MKSILKIMGLVGLNVTLEVFLKKNPLTLIVLFISLVALDKILKEEGMYEQKVLNHQPKIK